MNDAELIESAARKIAVLGHMPLHEARQHAAKALVEMRREERKPDPYLGPSVEDTKAYYRSIGRMG